MTETPENILRVPDQNKFLSNYLHSSSNYSQMTNTPIWITEANVVSLISLPEAVGALEQILVLEAAEKAAKKERKRELRDEKDKKARVKFLQQYESSDAESHL